MPYDRFARELLTASGSNFRTPPVNFYRAMQSKEPPAIAQTVALTFMGTRAEKWPQERLAGMAAFFSQIGYKETGEWKEEIVYFDAGTPAPRDRRSSPTARPRALAPGQDPREVFADWLIVAEESVVHARRSPIASGSWLLGRGIVHEPDDLRAGQSAGQPRVAGLPRAGTGGAKYDLKHLYRMILNSQTYQLSSIPRSETRDAAANFAYYPLRRLDAEVLDRRLLPDHRHHRDLQQRDPRTVHLDAGGSARRSPCPMAASPAPSWNCSDVRRATPVWKPSATTASPTRSACTC